jgi:thymidine kinase
MKGFLKEQGGVSVSGKITLIMGPMWAGKTNEIIRRIRLARYAGYTTKLFKYAKDTRYTKQSLVVSHDGVQEEAIPIMSAHFAMEGVEEGDIVFFEEGQFIADVAEVAELLANQGHQVFISALASDYKREPFPLISELIAKADKIIQLKAICHSCKGSASFTKRTVEYDGVELIGGSESYEASCRGCWKGAQAPL